MVNSLQFRFRMHGRVVCTVGNTCGGLTLIQQAMQSDRLLSGLRLVTTLKIRSLLGKVDLISNTESATFGCDGPWRLWSILSKLVKMVRLGWKK